MHLYDEDNCGTNNWLKPVKASVNLTWTMTPSSNRLYATHAFAVDSSGIVFGDDRVTDFHHIFPVGYLSSSVKIIDGSGEKNTPFIASLY